MKTGRHVARPPGQAGNAPDTPITRTFVISPATYTLRGATRVSVSGIGRRDAKRQPVLPMAGDKGLAYPASSSGDAS